MISVYRQLLYLILASLVVIVLGTLNGNGSISEFFRLKKSHEVLRETVKKLEQDNQMLELEIQKLNESPQYARKILRDKFHMTADNEKIIFF